MTVAAHVVDPQTADRIFDAALLTGTFTLRSGATSDVYFDKYRISTQPELLSLIAKPLWNIIQHVSPGIEAIVAPELGAVPIATAVSMVGNVPVVIVRSHGKDYGTEHMLEGVVTPGMRAVLLEDVVTSGGAALEAIAAARQAGIAINASVCVLDRGAGGGAALDTEHAPLTALFGADDWQLQCNRIRAKVSSDGAGS